MRAKNILLLLFFFGFGMTLNSQRPKIIENIEKNCNVKIKENKAVENIIKQYLEQDKSERFGYRVQVFSSNKQRLAKDKSAEIEAKIRLKYPNIGIYRMFVSPFWKVRVGNFGSREVAQDFMEELVRNFPDLRKGTYVVRETRLKNKNNALR